MQHVLAIFSLTAQCLCIHIKLPLFPGSAFPPSHVTGDTCYQCMGVRGLRYIRSLYGHIGPVERSSTEQHVSNERVNGSFADQSDEEQLFDDLSRYGTQ